MAHRQWSHLVAGLQEDLYSVFDRLAGPTNDRLLSAVYVGDYNVSVNGLQYSLDFSQRGKNRRHLSGIFHCHAASCPDRGH